MSGWLTGFQKYRRFAKSLWTDLDPARGNSRLIDLHIHLLPGLDDGASDVDATCELAAACVADGIDAVAATPHVSREYATRPAALEAALGLARGVVERASIPLKIYSGAEVAIDQLDQLTDDELRAFTIGPGGNHLLLETPYASWPLDLELHIGRLATLGIRAVLAHPERSAAVQESDGIEHLAFAVSRGVRTQVTAGSLSGRFGRTAQSLAQELLERELVHLVASDAHNAERRPPRMREAAAAVGSDELGRWLTEDAPLAILRGEPLPPRPAPPAHLRRGLAGMLPLKRQKKKK